VRETANHSSNEVQELTMSFWKGEGSASLESRCADKGRMHMQRLTESQAFWLDIAFQFPWTVP
jgi:hypothetical protein